MDGIASGVIATGGEGIFPAGNGVVITGVDAVPTAAAGVATGVVTVAGVSGTSAMIKSL